MTIEICGIPQPSFELLAGKPYILVHDGDALYALEALRAALSGSRCDNAVLFPFSVDRDVDGQCLSDKMDSLVASGYEGAVLIASEGRR